MTDDRTARYREAAERTAGEQRRIQQVVDRRDRERMHGEQGAPGGGSATEAPVQAGAREQPTNPLPKQHLTKPGLESRLQPRPNYLAPGYRGSEKLKNMVALITGGDSGIGRAVAVLFAREGADIAVAYLNEHADAEDTKRAVAAEGRRCITVSGDVRDPEFCRFAVERTMDELGGLDILVNNAAFQEHTQSLEELSDEHLDMTFRTNVYGYVQMARAALPHLRAGGSIINNGSETGLFGQPVLLDYSTTKGAVHAFTRALAKNVAARGIRVNAVAPGPVWTPLNPADKSPDQIPDFGHTTDMRRPAQPEEVAPAYVFLAAPSCAGYITGVVLPVLGSASAGA